MNVGACMMVDVQRLLKICLERRIEICVMVCYKYTQYICYLGNINLSILS